MKTLIPVCPKCNAVALKIHDGKQHIPQAVLNTANSAYDLASLVFHWRRDIFFVLTGAISLALSIWRLVDGYQCTRAECRHRFKCFRFPDFSHSNKQAEATPSPPAFAGSRAVPERLFGESEDWSSKHPRRSQPPEDVERAGSAGVCHVLQIEADGSPRTR
jgi:hypothetical protein